MKHGFEIKNGKLLKDGAEHRIISGAMHYFRIHPDYWEDRLRKLKACGFNAVDTYVPWNAHEPRPGLFVFDGMLDVVKYVEMAGRLGLDVLLRPGPYICSEWDFGGLPAWLLDIPRLRIRCANKPYMEAVERYFDAVLGRLRPLFSKNGGPIAAMQVENEYGSCASDLEYLAELKALIRRNGFDGLLFTSGGVSDAMISGGTLPDVWNSVNFGTDPEENLANLRRSQPDKPLFAGEFWDGQGVRWGVSKRMRDAEAIAADFDKTLALGAHVNVYMFHGGTNFGFMNGGLLGGYNHQESYGFSPFVGSYDVDALLDEAGEPTPKYHLFREIIAKYDEKFDKGVPVPPPLRKRAYGKVALTEAAPLFENLEAVSSGVHKSPHTDCMEAFGQSYGFILYRKKLDLKGGPHRLSIVEPRDRAQVFLDGRKVATLYRNDKSFDVQTDSAVSGEATLDVLVENMGRFNIGWRMDDNRKGISTGVVLDGHQLLNAWTIHTLPFEKLDGLKYKALEGRPRLPAFLRGTFEVDEAADTFLRLPANGKGVCWINGFNLGRFWNPQGPQLSLYIPGPLLKKGPNSLEILELERLDANYVELVDKP